MTMDVEHGESSTEKDNIFIHLANNDTIFFKSQQRNESDLTKQQKIDIASEIFNTNKVNFLLRFGQYLEQKHLDFFRQFTEEEDLIIVINDLSSDLKSNKRVKNRRFQALKELVNDSSYFSENEMMKRDPLLYDQMIGQYLSEEEKKERDRVVTDEQTTLVKLLLEGIERDDAEIIRKRQRIAEDSEDDSNEEEAGSSKLETSYRQWGEFENEAPIIKIKNKKSKSSKITDEEQEILREEFVSMMYQNFLEGKDDDFDYKDVDENKKYDDVDMKNHDEEEKYFDSEEPAIVKNNNELESEDELDVFMSGINQTSGVSELTKDMKNLGNIER